MQMRVGAGRLGLEFLVYQIVHTFAFTKRSSLLTRSRTVNEENVCGLNFWIQFNVISPTAPNVTRVV